MTEVTERAGSAASSPLELSGLDRVQSTPMPCMDCNSSKAIMLGTELAFDFDPSIIPVSLRHKFVTREDGVCFDCGLYQDYIRYSEDEMRQFTDFNKDETVSETAYKHPPVPPEYIDLFERLNVTMRIERWRAYFEAREMSPKRCLFLRPMFGAAPLFAATAFGADTFALEISKACRLTTEQRVPGIKFLEGQIHGALEGDFLKSELFDAIFIFHTLIHCIDIHNAITKISRLLTPHGVAVFSHEAQLKPHNPFHMVFPTERQMTRLLGQHFSTIERIDDCDPSPPPFITNYSIKGDSPDLVAWGKAARHGSAT